MQTVGFHSNDRFWYPVVTVNLKKIHKYSIFPLEFFTRRTVVILWVILSLYMKFQKRYHLPPNQSQSALHVTDG